MKKIAIITVTNGSLNFGNRLQNYALQAELERRLVSVSTIYSANIVSNSLFLSKSKRLLKSLKAVFIASGRKRAFEQFEKKYIVKAKRLRYGKLNEDEFSDEYDAFIAGSDQVWNPDFWFNSDFEFMTFAPPLKRYSYAASFGISEIPQQYQDVFAKRLRGIREISVREESAKEIVYNLTNRQAKVHVDPTMLLPAQSYIKMEENPGFLPERYLLLYSLGEFSPEYRAFAQQIAKCKGLNIVELNEVEGSLFYNIGPQHFLYMIHNAQYICTDSFHGSVFSIIFNKQFTAFIRQGKVSQMSTRIDTLLTKMKLEPRLFGRLSLEDSLIAIDYNAVEKCLEEERKLVGEYFQDIISHW